MPVYDFRITTKINILIQIMNYTIGKSISVLTRGQLTRKVIYYGGQGDSCNDASDYVCCESPYVTVLEHHEGVFGECRKGSESTADAYHQEENQVAVLALSAAQQSPDEANEETTDQGDCHCRPPLLDSTHKCHHNVSCSTSDETTRTRYKYVLDDFHLFFPTFFVKQTIFSLLFEFSPYLLFATVKYLQFVNHEFHIIRPILGRNFTFSGFCPPFVREIKLINP